MADAAPDVSNEIIESDEIQMDDGEDPDESIDFALVYALHTFVANLEGQVCVLKGDSLELLDDSNSYWWLVKCIKTDEIGYIPAENVETPFERLARLNRTRNIQLSAPNNVELSEASTVMDSPRGVNSKGATVVFSEHNTEIYESGSDSDSETAVSTTSSELQAQQKTKKQEGGKGKLNIFQRLLSAYSTSKKFTTVTSPSPESMFATSHLDQQAPESPIDVKSETEPINVLRIYAGNVDLKATFKTVALTKAMTVSELLSAALRRFRVPESSIGEYYLTVLHMDSQERKLPNDDLVMQILENLRSRHLPGISDTRVSQAVDKQGRISSVRVNDDNIIRFIINKQLYFEKDYHLIRVIMYDENDPTGKIRTYKTIGVNNENTVEEIVRIAAKKFKTPAEKRYDLTIRQKGLDTVLNGNEKVYEVLIQNELEQIDFILTPKIGSDKDTTEESQLQVQQRIYFDRSEEIGEERISRKNTPDLEAILQSKPSFLQEFPTNINSIKKESPPEQTYISAQPNQSPWHTSEIHEPTPQPSTPTNENAAKDMKSSFQFMEEYLEEIMKDTVDSNKVQQLEVALKQNTKRDSRSEPIDYNDHGLKNILAPTSPVLETPNPRKLSTRSSKSSLREMYNSLEAELDKTMTESMISIEDERVQFAQCENTINQLQKELDNIVMMVVQVYN